jgi:hypothetical protein
MWDPEGKNLVPKVPLVSRIASNNGIGFKFIKIMDHVDFLVADLMAVSNFT